MKLSEIVRYRNNLDIVTPQDIETQVLSEIKPVIHTVNTGEIQLPNLLNQLVANESQIIESVKDFRNTLVSIKQEIDQIIESMEPTYLAHSYRLYNEMRRDSPEYILKRKLALEKKSHDYILNRIQMYTDWQQPGAILRPGEESWIEHMVGCDPLYVIDTNYGLFTPVKNKFNKIYLNRLRFYRVIDSERPGILNDLPDEQFGFFLAYNFFHYKPFDIFKSYLTEIYNKLDRGGCLAFTFNDCDRWGAVDLVENQFMCYTPGRLVRSLCESLGYEINSYYVMDNATTWLEVRKPGRHVSIKGGQTLAEIIEKSK